MGPLHNPANLMGIEACEEAMPDTPMWRVFDTAFGQTMPEKAYLYAIPYEYYEKYGSEDTASTEPATVCIKENSKVLGRPCDSLKTVICHLGNGSSISASSTENPWTPAWD